MVTLDSRLVKPGDVFVAIKGEKADGHDYIDSALAKGAADVIDGVEELQARAKAYRQTLKAKVIGVTGSSGKTTTKEFIKTFLGCYGTEGNYNNHLGVPLTILNAPRDAKYIVVELGTNHPGEIAGLCDIADPDIGVITSIGTAHLEFFKTQAGIAREKGTLFAHARDFNVMPQGCCEADILREMSAVRRVEVEPTKELECPVPGLHNLLDMSLAYAVARELGVSEDECRRRLEGFELPGARWRKIQAGAVTYIDDSYNANPDSMKAALDAFKGQTVVLGDMGELGDDSARMHREVLDYAYRKGLKVITVGPMFAKAELSRITQGEVLLKGSHAMHLSKLIERKN